MKSNKLSKEKRFFNSVIKDIKRSEIHPAPYNPREIDEEGKKQLRRSIKNFGVLGGIIINSQTGNTIVGGHQKVFIMDDINKYDENTMENDYTLRVEVIDVDEKTEKEINILLNNPNVGGAWDYDKLKALLPDVDYKNAGLTDADLSMIGVDFILQTEKQNDITADLDFLNQPSEEFKKEEHERREAEKAFEREQKIQAMKDLKEEVKRKAQEKAGEHSAYVVLSFSEYSAKAQFCERFGFEADQQYIKGEEFEKRCEVSLDY